MCIYLYMQYLTTIEEEEGFIIIIIITNCINCYKRFILIFLKYLLTYRSDYYYLQ